MDTRTLHSIRVFRLKGTRRERAHQHGSYVRSLSAAERSRLVFTPLSKKNQTLIKRALPLMPGLGRMFSKLYEAFVLARFLKLPKAYRDRLEPFARTSGLSLKTIWLSLYQPDFLMALAAGANERLRNRFLEGVPGCSTMSVDAGDEIYFLRNLDYPAADYWEKHPAVLYHEPSEPGLQKFVSISSVGIDTAGLTGCNESGVAFSLHAHFAKTVSMNGVPIFFLGEEILENAKTLDEAIAIASRFRTIGSWAVNLTSFKEKKSICLELSGGRTEKREMMSGILAHANDFASKRFQSDAVHFNSSVFEDSESRRKSLEKSAEVLRESFTWPKALAALGNHTDQITGERHVFGNSTSVVTTIQSVGFDWKENCIYLSNRMETPTGLGPFVKLPMSFDDLEVYENLPPVEPAVDYDDDFRKAVHLYHQAYVAWQVNGEESDVAHAYLVQACELRPNDPHLHLQCGYFEMMGDNAKAAHTCFDQALKFKLSPSLTHVALYFRGTCLDLLGNREAALADYRTILDAPRVDAKIAKKAKKRLNQAYKKRMIRSISPDLQFAEPIDYR